MISRFLFVFPLFCLSFLPGQSQMIRLEGGARLSSLQLSNSIVYEGAKRVSDMKFVSFDESNAMFSGIETISDSLSSIFYDYYDGQLFVKLNGYPDMGGIQEDVDLREAAFLSPEILAEFGITSIKKPFYRAKDNFFGIRQIYQIYFSKIHKWEQLIQRLERFSFVEYAELVPILRKTLVPNDLGANSTSGTGQWHLHRIQSQLAWDITTGSSNIVVAIVDDAVKINHPDLQPNVWINPGEIPGNGIDDDGNGYIDDINGFDVSLNVPSPLPPNVNYSHGTHVAGCASQATNNGIGGAGIGFSVKLMAVKSTNSSSSISHGYPGVVYAADAGANVINMSWGGTGGGTTGQNIMNYANSKGIILVAAAGNSNNTQTFFPAGFNHVISVASTTITDTKSGFSNFGSYVKISSPGSEIQSTYLGGSGTSITNTYGRISGTSMASPIVAGLVGLMFSVNPNLTKQQVENCLYSTADPVAPGTGYNVNQMGAGRINAYQCLQCVASTVNGPPVAAISTQGSASICPGGSVNFLGGSNGGPASSYLWSFPGGNPSTSTQSNPVVSYANLGTYDVTLTTTNSFGNNTTTQQNYVNVGPGAQTLIFREDFEVSSPTVGNWSVQNSDNSNTWVLANTNGNITGTRSARMNFFGYTAVGQRDQLYSPALDLSNYSGISLSFTHAYRRRQGGSTAPSDSLIVLVSIDGGTSFSRVLAAAENGSGSFATGVVTTTSFTPGTAADWCFGGDVGASCFSINLPQLSGQSNVFIAFEGYNNNQNNFYIDDVELRGLCVPPPASPVADFMSNKNIICEEETVQFTDNSSNSSSWSWTFQGGAPASSTAQNPLIYYGQSGSYSVSLSVFGVSGNDSNTWPNYITVNPKPNAQISESGGVLTALPSGLMYQWYLNGQIISGETNQTYTPTSDGNYTVRVTSNEGCFKTSAVFSFKLGVLSGEALGFSLYPNPSQEWVIVDFGKIWEGDFQIYLLDQAGRQILRSKQGLGKNNPIYLKQIPAGSYLLKIISPEGEELLTRIQILP